MGSLLDGLITWSIRRRALVLLAAVALTVAGLWSAGHATTDVLPDFTPPRVVVQTEAPGMGTADVETLVTRPIERALLGTPGAETVRSTSAPGLSVITLMFEEGADLYRVRQLVAERVALTSGRLPQAVRAPQLAPISAPIGALLKFCVTVPPGGEQPARDARAFAEWTLRPRLLAIPGVAQVTVLGGRVERVEVRPDPARMRARGVTVADVTDAVRRSQAVSGAGFVESGGARLDVQDDARLTLAGAAVMLGDAVVVAARGAPPIRLGDVADVVRGDEPAVGAAIYDGRPALFVQVNKLPWADTLDVTRRVERELAALRRELPAGARMEPPVFRQATFVRRSIGSVGRAMAIGAALVVAVLLAFLRSGRLAAISLVSIPLSMLTAVLVLVATGTSINGMTLGGLALAVGEVVDDAIVDVENVWRRLGENARSAAPRPAEDVIHDASREVRGSVVYATVIVCLVLVPVLLLGGIAGRIFAPLARAYILAIGASLLVALTVTPAMCAWLLPRLATAETRPTRFAAGLLVRYGRLLRAVASRPRTVFTLAGLLAGGAIVVVPFLGGRFLPEFREGALIATVIAAPGTSLDETLRLAGRVDAQLRDGFAPHVAARAGRAALDDDAAPPHRVEMDVLLPPDDDREAEVLGAETAVRIGRVPGLGFVVEGFLGERVHEILSGETAPVVVRVVGPDLGPLRALAARAAAVMRTTPGLGAVQVEPQLDVPQLRVRPDRVALARYGVRALDLADELVAWRQGRAWTQILGADGRVVDVVVAGPPPLRERDALRDVPIATPAMGSVSLGTLADIDLSPVPAVVHHEAGERRIHVTAGARGAGLSRAVARLTDRLAREVPLPAGYRLDVGGEAVARSEAATRLLLVGGLVLLGVFLLLAVAFGSSRDAGIVLLNFPLGLLGGVVAALLTPEGLSVAGFVGFVTLFGIIARNGIMLVAHKRHLDAERPDEDPVERVFRAAEERLLPITMTAVTAGLGLLPLALSFESAGSELEAPMALIVCGGLVTSTALNMLVLPTVYVWLARRGAARAAG
ncbi:MAG: efflux RND transporter permease subunit [Myxococcaceae bacterium]|nr:MAG: efflux RND transporter permease subunit [Myxococcaceae bacterium]